MKKAVLFLLVTLLTGLVQAQTKRLAVYYCKEDNVSYSLNFFTNNLSYFIYTDANGKQVSFQAIAAEEKGTYKYTTKSDATAQLQVKDPGIEFPEKLKGKFTLGGKTVKLVFRKDEKGIVD